MKSWYVVAVKPRKEDRVVSLFSEAGFEVYCPRYVKEKKVRPFFPGYLFLLFDFPGQYSLVKYTRGVRKVIADEHGPIPLPDRTILEMKAREMDGLIVVGKHGEEPAVGDGIEVVEGPLRGLRGVFVKEMSDRERVMVLLDYISYQGSLLIERRKLKKTDRT
jgi:transcription antitermination factor NusG